MLARLPISILPFLISSFAVAQKCHRGAFLLTESFPIENYYNQHRLRYDGGRPLIPRGKAFILWRERTPGYIPDSAFLWHYVEDENIQRAGVALASPEVTRDPFLLALPHLGFNDKVVEAREYAAEILKQASSKDFVLLNDIQTPRFVSILVEGELKVLFFISDVHNRSTQARISHQNLWNALKRKYPDAEFQSAGHLLLDLVGAKDSQKVIVRVVNTQAAWVMEQNNRDREVILEEIRQYLES